MSSIRGPLHYSFSFTQFPIKEFNELWDEFVHGKLSERIEKKIIELQQKHEELVKLPQSTQKTFYEDRDEWVQCQKNRETTQLTEKYRDDWKKLKETFVKQESSLQDATSEKDIQAIVKETFEIFMKLFGRNTLFAPSTLFVEDCHGYGDSAKGNGYAFLQHLYHKVHDTDLSGLNAMPTNEQWYTMFQALKPDFIEAEFVTFFANEHIREEEERKDARKESLELLHIIKGLLKECLDRKWELWFTCEFQTVDVEMKRRKALEKECAQKIISTLPNSEANESTVKLAF